MLGAVSQNNALRGALYERRTGDQLDDASDVEFRVLHDGTNQFRIEIDNDRLAPCWNFKLAIRRTVS